MTRLNQLSRLVVAVVCGTIATSATAQPPTIGINQLGGTTIASGGSFGVDGTITSVTGTAGVNPGYSLFTYGDPGNAGQNLDILAFSTNPATTRFWTAPSATPTTSGVADGFLTTNPAVWGILRREVGATAQINLPVSDGSGTMLALDNPANLAAYNTRLNDVFKFQPDQFYKSTGILIAPTDGTFAFTFSDFSGGRYNGIDLTYSPVPEPATILGLSAVGAMVIGGVRRFRRKTDAVIA